MKIKPEHYRHMRDSIKAVDLPALHESILKDGKYKDFSMRFRHDALHKAGLTPWICANLYSYLNDDHIDTALRAIMREIS